VARLAPCPAPHDKSLGPEFSAHVARTAACPGVGESPTATYGRRYVDSAHGASCSHAPRQLASTRARSNPRPTDRWSVMACSAVCPKSFSKEPARAQQMWRHHQCNARLRPQSRWLVCAQQCSKKARPPLLSVPQIIALAPGACAFHNARACTYDGRGCTCWLNLPGCVDNDAGYGLLLCAPRKAHQ